MQITKTTLFHWISALQATAGVACAAALLGGTTQIGYSALWIIVLALVWTGSLAFWREQDRRMQVCFGALGAAFALSCAEAYGWRGVPVALAHAVPPENPARAE